MAVLANLTDTNDIVVTAREIDFVTKFARNWEALREIMGIMRPIKKTPGAVLKSKEGSITLQSGSVTEGDVIPFSEAKVVEKTYAEMSLDKYAKSVSIEAIKDHGYDIAVAKTDEAFLYELQKATMDKFYTYLKTGTLTNIQTSYQAGLAMAKGYVVDKWQKMHRTCTEVVAFVNALDVYEYLGGASITIQSEFGFEYIKNFMGLNTIFLLGSDCVPRGQILATPVENIVMYYVDPAEGDFARAGLVYAVEGETNLIGFHTEGDYTRAVSNCYAVTGVVLFAEYLDGIANIKIQSSGSLGSVTVTSAAGTASGDSKVKAVYTLGVGEKLYYKEGADAPAYKDIVDLTGWTEIEASTDVNISGLTSGATLRVVAVNGSCQALASGNATVVVKA